MKLPALGLAVVVICCMVRIVTWNPQKLTAPWRAEDVSNELKNTLTWSYFQAHAAAQMLIAVFKGSICHVIGEFHLDGDRVVLPTKVRV